MTNMQVDVKGNTLTITVQLDQQHGPSASGKTIIVASSCGAVKLPTGESVNLNVYRSK